MLNDAGIQAFVADEHLVSTQWLYSTAVGGVRLQVPGEDADVARELLAQASGPELAGLEESSQPPVDGDLCPACRSSAVRPSHTKRSALAVSLLLDLPLFLWRRRWVCEACGHSWRMARSRGGAASLATEDAEERVRERPGSYQAVGWVWVLVLAGLIISTLLQRPGTTG